LYGHPEKMLGTWLRLDIPILGFTNEYILYTDVDVVFQHDVDLISFGSFLPTYFTMGTEGIGARCRLAVSPNQSVNVGNAGVLLMNLNGMRRTHEALISWVFSERRIKEGLYFKKFGPGDQGALNQFYQGKFLVRRWPIFNWKPYWGYSAQASIIHFHGPKPLDYLCHLTDPQQQEGCWSVTGGVKLYDDIMSKCSKPHERAASKLEHVRTDGFCSMNSSFVAETKPVRVGYQKENCHRNVASYLAFRSQIVSQERTGIELMDDSTKEIVLGQDLKDGRIDRLLAGVLQQWPLLKEWIDSDPVLASARFH
jgi:hypothetical protein